MYFFSSIRVLLLLIHFLIYILTCQSYVSYYNSSKVPSQTAAGVLKLGALQICIRALDSSVLEVKPVLDYGARLDA